MSSDLGPTAPLPRATPSAKGVDTSHVHRFLDAVEAAGIELHSFLLYRGGAVVVEGFWRPYSAGRLHMLHSATKSWTAMAAGLAIESGRLHLDDTVASFFPSQLPPAPSANLLAMRVRDLLTMRTGHRSGISGGEWRGMNQSWVGAFLKEAVAEPPGHTFIYSSGSSYMLSAIVSTVMGETVHSLLDRTVFRPLEMGCVEWDVSPEGFNTGGNGLSCVSEDALKFGVLHLQGGQWNGQQILSADWVKQATFPHVAEARLGVMDGRRYAAPSGTDQVKRDGYGYQWWMTPHGGYRASGLFGQHTIVLPGHDAVIVFTAAVQRGDSRLLELVWHHLIPALDSEPALATRLAHLALPEPVGQAEGPLGSFRYAIAPNAAGVTGISLDLTAESCVFTMTDARGEHRITAGFGHTVEGITSMTGNALHHEYQPGHMRVLAHAVWRGDAELCMSWRFIETAFCDTVTCRFTQDGMVMERRVNANAGLMEMPPLEGSLVRQPV